MTRPPFIDRLAALQVQRPMRFIVVAYLLAAVAVPLILQLGLKTGFHVLLPEDKPSVVDMRAARSRIGGLTTLTLALQSDDRQALQDFARELVPRLDGLKDQKVRYVDWNIASYEQFVMKHKHLYANLEDLTQIRDDLDDRVAYEKANANPLYVSLDDEEPPDPKTIIERLKNKADKGKSKLDKYPGGFFLHPERNVLLLFLRTDLKSGDATGAAALITAVEGQIADSTPTKFASDMRVEFGGGLLSAREEHDAIAREMVISTVLTIVLVFVVIYIFFRRKRAIPLLGAALLSPVLITFGFAELAVDFLNTSTVFLGSIVIGNGVNPNIIWLARYFEERRGGVEVRAAVANAHRASWSATLVASSAASIAYGSLIVTDFRGFRDFGIIGGVGMILCWLGAYLLLPSLSAMVERYRPMTQGTARAAAPYGRLFVSVLQRFPRAILVVSAVTGIASGVIVVQAIMADPIEYNFKKLRSIRDSAGRASTINRWAKQTVGRAGEGAGVVMLLPTREQAIAVRDGLDEGREQRGAPIGKVHAIDGLLPQDQAAKIPVVAEIRALLLNARKYANEKQQKEIDDNLPPDDLRPLVDADLPSASARRYMERDGSLGRILYIEQQKGQSTWDGRYLMRWAQSLRTTRVDDGSRPPVVGRATVFADIVEVIWHDGPKAIAVAFIATTLLLLLSFRSLMQRMLTLGALLLGIAWMGASMVQLDQRLNFLNFVAFPITFGNGVDYGVNVMRRYALERGGRGAADAVSIAVRESGGAVILCSLTTIICYSSLYVSANQALNSFGLAMAISEITCLLAAVLSMPAYLVLRGDR